MFSDADMLRLQQDQYRHDARNHTDILHLSKNDRLKHYGLHFAKYVGRLARGSAEPISYDRTIIDTVLVSLSAANTMHQHLEAPAPMTKEARQIDPLRTYADAAGRFADACEKIDHMEAFIPIAHKANADIMSWAIHQADERQIDLEGQLRQRRGELRGRQFYIAE
ncbi:hypothetical protein FJW06_05105 [Mesorhizobium sp. B4-1-3]|uniref:hypothetical protein n=1 Tax=Mesorhizobium sp. B4-1-3 TaxID=2589889 RepID=UPI00112C97F8|nr:hypothetical protein [Mesorhizobium sp. B4-1-3]TPI15714.1 hypothetical protein FJW06_05105 [Mesorhizobium sp. B4-1-3]